MLSELFNQIASRSAYIMQCHSMRMKLFDNHIRILFDTPNQVPIKYIEQLSKLVPTNLQIYEAPNRIFLIGDPTNSEYLKEVLAHEMQELVKCQQVVLDSKKHISTVLQSMVNLKESNAPSPTSTT